MSERERALYLNLIDAWCDESTALNCIAMLKEGRQRDALTMIERYRAELLRRVHDDERRIDRLDFFAYTVRKGTTE